MTGDYRALVCITTCNRPEQLRRYLPHFAAHCAADTRFALVVALDGDDQQSRAVCNEWEIPLIWSDEREGVGISKNRALERFPDYDYYFFVEDDVELLDGRVFADHVEIARTTGIQHLALFEAGGVRKQTGETRTRDHWIVHGCYGSADFNFYTAEALERVGGWHPLFAQYRRWGHTEHSYRVYRAGLAPAPFNVAEDLTGAFIWHRPPTVTAGLSVPIDDDQIAAPERELMQQELTHFPVTTLSAVHSNDVPVGPPRKLAATLDGEDRYPLVDGRERRQSYADYRLWEFKTAHGPLRRLFALLAAAAGAPRSPALRHTLKTALRR